MINHKKIVVVMPAYNASQTLKKTIDEIPFDVVDDVLLVDDASQDATYDLSVQYGIRSFRHEQNLGYGGNQKTCYSEALKLGADVVVMLHPDYQYSPKIIPALAGLVASGEYDVTIGSRILGGKSIQGGMPLYKFFSNRVLTICQNILLGSKLSEFHTGFRAFSRDVLENLPLLENSDDFVFDNQMLAQSIYFNYKIGEVSCPTKYFKEASSINFSRSVSYGIGVLITSWEYRLQAWGLKKFNIFNSSGRKIASCRQAHHHPNVDDRLSDQKMPGRRGFNSREKTRLLR